MQTTISEQIKAVQAARAHAKASSWDMEPALSDAAQTLLALKMILSGDIGKEFEDYFYSPNRLGHSAGNDFIDFLRQKGLDLTKIK